MSISVDKGKKPKGGKGVEKFPFDEMNPGESFLYEGPRSGAIVNFAYRAIRGKYIVEKEGDGWRFYMLEDPLHPKKGRKEKGE